MSIQQKMERLLAERRPGHSLPQPFYTDEEVYRFDLEAIFNRHWLQVAHESEIEQVGDYLTVAIGASSVVITRNEAGGISAFFNSCRHRGAMVCREAKGHAKRLTCPYHQWSYDLRGNLLRASSMQAGFDPKPYRLKPVHVRTVAGLIYIHLGESPQDFEPFRQALEAYLAPHDFRNAKLVCTIPLVERANWKLVMENARECYHCRSGHGELMRAFRDFTTQDIYAAPEPWMKAFWQRCEGLGLLCGPVSGAEYEVSRFPLAEGAVSLTMDGKPAVQKRLVQAGDGDVGSLWWAIQPHAFNHAVGDYVFSFSVFPSGPQETVVLGKWYVHKDAVEGVDYQRERLLEVWNATNNQDRWLAENNQRGVNSLGYIPGPYSEPTEGRVLKLIDWYCRTAASYLEQQRARD